MPLILILLIIAWFGSFFGPLLADLRSGNVNRLQFSLIALLTWLLANDEDPSSDAAAGAVLAFAVLFKPNLMMVAGMLFWYWIVALRWRRLAWCAAGALIGGTASLAASAAFFGTFGCWRNWSDIAANMKDEWFPIDLGNYSLSESILAGTGTRPGTWLATVIIGTALSLVAWAARRARAADARQSDFLICRAPEPVLIAVGCGLWTLTAHLAWYHYSVLALPLVIWTLRPFSELPAASMVWRCVQRTIGVIALLCFHPVVGGEMFTRSRWVWPLVLNIVVALLIAVALAERLRVSRNRNVS